jgi:HSP20 family protein
MALLTYPNAYPFPYWEPYPTTFLSETVPEQGSHHHHIPHPHWGEKVAKLLHDKDSEVHKPQADVRETSSAFHIDVELPGLSNKSDLTLKWLSTRTILVSCRIRREAFPPVEKDHPNGVSGDVPETPRKEAAVDQEIDNSAKERKSCEEDAAGSTAALHEKRSHQEQHHSTLPHLTLGERNIGLSTRAFNFPCDVDRDHTKAKLSAGLLTLDVPKQHHEEGSHPEIEVQFDGRQMPLFKDP